MRKAIFIAVSLGIINIFGLTLASPLYAGDATPPAQQAERPTFEEGYKLTFRNPSNGAVWTQKYLGKEGDLLVFEGSNPGNPKTAKWYYTEDMNLVRSKGRKYEIENDPHNGGFNFPLFVDKKWRHYFTNTVGNNVAQRTVWAEVKAYEQVTVPAGTFWTYRIEVVNQRAGVPLPAYETFWYAPEAKSYVKYYSKEFQSEAELVEYGK